MIVKSVHYNKYARLLWLILLLGQCFGVVQADVAIRSLTQSPANPVIAGSTVTYSLTVVNLEQQLDASVAVDIYPGADLPAVTDSFSSPDCSLDGSFNCGALAANSSQTYVFSTVITEPGEYPFDFSVSCGVSCVGDFQVISPTTTVVAESGSTGMADTAGLTDNEIQVAVTLDNACSELNQLNQSESITAAQAKLLSVCNELDGADDATTLSALQQITPSQAPAQANLSVQSSNTQLNNVNARLSALRGGASGYSVMGLTLNYGGLAIPANLLVNHQNNLKSGVNEDSKDFSILPKLGIFINGNVSFGDKDDTVDELGFDFNTYGITAGADYRIRDSLVAGGAIGIVNTDSNFNHSQGNVDISGLSLLAYSTYFVNEATYLEAVISYGRNNFDNSRNISVGLINYEAQGKTDGNEKTVSIGAGYDISRGPTTLGSYLKLNYIRADIDGYTESSNSGLELTFQRQTSESLTMNLGGQVSYAVSMDYGIIMPTLRLDWTHEYQDDSRFVTASFLNDPSQAEFTINTDSPDRDYFQLGLGASVTFGSGRSAYFFYESILGQSNLTQNSVTGGLRIDF